MKRKRSLVCRYVSPPGECYCNTLLRCDYFSSSSVVSRAFSALYVYSKFGHHPHPLDYRCAKFRFFRVPHRRASPWRKIAYSINHSPRLAYLMPWEPKRLCVLGKKRLRFGVPVVHHYQWHVLGLYNKSMIIITNNNDDFLLSPWCLMIRCATNKTKMAEEICHHPVQQIGVSQFHRV